MSEQNNAKIILEQSWKLFQKKGYRGVSVEEICQQCNLTKPTLYYYFKNKETLFIKVLENKLQDFNSSIIQSGSLTQSLERIALIILESFEFSYSSLMREHEHFKNFENAQKIREAFQKNLFGPPPEINENRYSRKKTQKC